jgi:hypothetical protein
MEDRRVGGSTGGHHGRVEAMRDCTLGRVPALPDPIKDIGMNKRTARIPQPSRVRKIENSFAGTASGCW